MAIVVAYEMVGGKLTSTTQFQTEKWFDKKRYLIDLSLYSLSKGVIDYMVLFLAIQIEEQNSFRMCTM